MKPTRTMIVIADGANARILLNQGPGKGIRQIDSIHDDTARKKARQIMADKPGRTFDSHGEGRHAMAYSSDPVRVAQGRFVARLAAYLDKRLQGRDFDRLVLVAEPRTLGELRAALSEKVKKLIYGELDKDLTKTPTDELGRHLGAVMAV